MNAGKLIMHLNGNRIYVYGDSKNFMVCLPGDLLNITNKLTNEEKEKIRKKLRDQEEI